MIHVRTRRSIAVCRPPQPGTITRAGAALTLCLVTGAALAGCSDGSSGHGAAATLPAFEARAIDGSGNSQSQATMGSAGLTLNRMLSADYGDGSHTPAGASRPSARAVSNAVHAQTSSRLNSRGASDLFWLWGQFIDHDIDLTPAAEPHEAFAIAVPQGDAFFDPTHTGSQTITLNRSVCQAPSGVRQQLNMITAWLDGSVVYGSDATRQAALRSNDGSGRLLVESTALGDMLPRNTAGLPNEGGVGAQGFLAGDVRANENVLLTAMHTLWVREHNWQVARYRALYPGASGDELYELARRWVGAELQAITYEEWLPILLGSAGVEAYRGYDPAQSAGIYNAFSTACFRFGHSLLSPRLQRLEVGLQSTAQGELALRDAFFSPAALEQSGGLEPLLRGAARQTCQELDPFVVDEVRNFLFGPPGSGGLDLAALNIQRGRDHGLPGYNQARVQLGLAARTHTSQIGADPQVHAALDAVYGGDVDAIDLWTGALAEAPVGGALVGELLRAVLGRQFAELRRADRFDYERAFSGADLATLRATRLIDVVRRNTDIDAELQGTLFLLR